MSLRVGSSMSFWSAILLVGLAGCGEPQEPIGLKSVPQVSADDRDGIDASSATATIDLETATDPVQQQDSEPTQDGGATTDDEEPIERRFIPQRYHQLEDLERVEIVVDGEHRLPVFVMDDMSKIREGMMFLRDGDIGEREGMIFVFPRADYQSFWMMNTLIPLDIAFLEPDGTVLNTHRMPVERNPSNPIERYPSIGRAQYVLEFKQGLFEKLEIGRGSTVELPEGLEAKP